MATINASAIGDINEQTYKRRIWAWTMYDWANSAFVTTITTAVLPVYFYQVAGATLPSANAATSLWGTFASVSLLITAVLAPILGTISDVGRGKKRFLSLFVSLGIIATALLVMVETGDWILAAILVIIGRIGFSGANTFYDALLPHVAKEEDRDKVSTRGYAMGYLGGGLLLAINVVMIQYIPGTWGTRLAFLSVAIWWGVFSIPLFRRIPEPPAATIKLSHGENVVGVSIKRLFDTLKDIRHYRELFKYLIAFIIYNDGIGTIIIMATIYGSELGFGTVELVLAILLVQFVGIPFSLIFGRLPSPAEKRRPFYLAFILFNLIALPLVGIAGKNLLSQDITGQLSIPYKATANAVGQGVYFVDGDEIKKTGTWRKISLPASQTGADSDSSLLITSERGASVDLSFNGDSVAVIYSLGPDHGIWIAHIDGQPLLDPATGEQIEIDAYNPTTRYEVSETFQASSPGEHTLSLVNTGRQHADSQGAVMTVSHLEILPPSRTRNLGVILGIIIAVELVGLALAYFLGPIFFTRLAATFDTRRSILLALTVYFFIAIWAFFLDSTIEFWFLACMVAVVQGGSQALSRSLYASMSPATKSGEFFGFFGVLEKFSAILGPIIFAAASVLFGSSRLGIISLIVFFVLGGYLLTRVNIEEGKRVARAEDAQLLSGESTT